MTKCAQSDVFLLHRYCRDTSWTSPLSAAHEVHAINHERMLQKRLNSQSIQKSPETNEAQAQAPTVAAPTKQAEIGTTLPLHAKAMTLCRVVPRTPTRPSLLPAALSHGDSSR